MEPALRFKGRLLAYALIFVTRKVYDFANVFAFAQIIGSIEQENYEKFLLIIGVLIAYILMHQLFNFFHIKKYGFFERIMRQYIYEKYLPRLIEADNNYVESMGTGKMITVFTKGMDTWSALLQQLIWKWVSMLTMMFFVVVMVANISWRYFLFFMWATILFDFIAIKLKDVGNKYRTQKYEQIAEWNRATTRYVMSKNEIMQNSKAVVEAKRIGAMIANIRRISRQQRPYEHFAYQSIEVGLIIVKIVTLFGMGRMVFAWEISIAELVGIVTILSYLSSSTQEFVNMIKDYIKDGVNLQRFWEFLDTAPRIKNFDTGEMFEYKLGDIVLKSISYGYHAKSKVLSNFSLHIQWKKKTALVWPSGSGKSTLIKLIAGYLRPDEGAILVDGWDLSTVSLQSYFKHIWYLTQEPSVFDGTIRENLFYATTNEGEGISQEKLDDVIQLSQCQFIYDLPHGLDTEIGEKGVRLSGGQRQRLAIAKILFKNPQIILLDEPTSALDSFAEEQVTKAFHNLFAGRTVIVIAHRLQTVKHADDIVVLWTTEQRTTKEAEQWAKIIERGTHEELIAKGWYYAKMLELQSGF